MPNRISRRTIWLSGVAIALTLIGVFGGVNTAIIYALIVLAIGGLWASWKFWKWHKFYGTRFLWGLFLVSLGADLASVVVALIAGARLVIPVGQALPPEAGIALGLALMVLEGVFIFLVLKWDDLDKDMKRVREGSEDETSHANLPPGGFQQGEDFDGPSASIENGDIV